MRFFEYALEEYYSSVRISCYVIFFIVAILYLVLSNVEDYKKNVILGSTISILVLVILNPIYYKILIKISHYSYYRLFWLIPADIIIGYVIVEIIKNTKKKTKKIIFSLFMLILFVIFGETPEDTAFGIVHYDNLYKVSQQAIDMTQVIMDDLHSNNKRALAPTQARIIMKGYDASVDIIEDEKVWYDLEKIKECMKKNNCSYLITEYQIMDEYLDKNEFYKLLDTSDYSIYVKITT